MQQIVYPTAMNNLAAFLTRAHNVGSWCMDGRRRRCEDAAEDRKWLPSTFFFPQELSHTPQYMTAHAQGSKCTLPEELSRRWVVSLVAQRWLLRLSLEASMAWHQGPKLREETRGWRSHRDKCSRSGRWWQYQRLRAQLNVFILVIFAIPSHPSSALWPG